MNNYNTIFNEILKKYGNSEKWSGSIFEKMKLISNTHVGSVGQDYIVELCRILKLNIELPPVNRSPWDIKIEGICFELKTASEDTNNNFQFNHIRYHRNYDALICLGVAPNNLYFNLWSKADLTTGKAGKLVSMERQANASYKLTKNSKDLYSSENFDNLKKEFIKKFKSNQ